MNEKGYGVITEKPKPAFQASDYVHISNEVSPKRFLCFNHKGRVFCVKPNTSKPYSIWEMQHCWALQAIMQQRFWEQTFIQTLNWYKANGINTFGGGLNQDDANKPLVLTLKDGTRLGFIGFNELLPTQWMR